MAFPVSTSLSCSCCGIMILLVICCLEKFPASFTTQTGALFNPEWEKNTSPVFTAWMNVQSVFAGHRGRWFLLSEWADELLQLYSINYQLYSFNYLLLLTFLLLLQPRLKVWFCFIKIGKLCSLQGTSSTAIIWRDHTVSVPSQAGERQLQHR